MPNQRDFYEQNEAGGPRWQGLDPWDVPPPVRLSGRPPNRNFWPVFALFLLLIVGITIALVVEGSRTAVSSPDGLGDMLPPFATPEATDAPTTVARTPALGDFTLPVAAQPSGEALSFQAIYQKVIPCVVSVRGTTSSGGSFGTGVIASPDGYIITNSHVIQGCSAVSIMLQDDQVFPAKLVGRDSRSDLAVLKIEAGGLSPAEFGDSEQLQVGDVSLAIGNPLGENLRGTMTDGIISAINRDMMVDGNSMVLLQTTAALNSGNSGGALLNAYGQVVGITNMKMSSYYNTVEGLGFAIPTTTVKAVVDELIAGGYIGGRPTIGITVRTLTQDAADAYGVPLGLRVETVTPKSDAEAKGVRPGDVIVAANGTPVYTGDALNAIKETLRAGDTLELRIYRDGAYLDIPVVLVEQYVLDE